MVKGSRWKQGKAVSDSAKEDDEGFALMKLYRFDSSVGRGDFPCKIGVGQVIRGRLQLEVEHWWDY